MLGSVSARRWVSAGTLTLAAAGLAVTSAPTARSAPAAAPAATTTTAGTTTTSGTSTTPGTAATAQGSRRLTWTACRDGFQCATLFAPLDYDQPDGVQVALPLIKLPAGQPARRIGSLLLNPGGPGGSGVDFARGFAKFLPLQVRARFDVVGFDPRGIMRSSPLRCFDTFDQAVAGVPPFAFPLTAREERVLRDADRTLADACAGHGGPILSHMSTADVARDMDLMRETFGDARLNYLGYSYGSVLGQVYANLFPNRVRALVIDGVLDPIAWTTGRGTEASTTPFSVRIRSDQGALRTLNEFFRLCDAAGKDCAFSGSASKRYATLAARLRAHPIEIDEGDGQTSRFTYADLVSATLGGMYEPTSWPDGAEFLAAVEDAASPATLGRLRAKLSARLGLAPLAQEPYPNFIEGGLGVSCSDSINPRTFAQWRRAVHAAARRTKYFGRAWGWSGSVCTQWSRTAGQDRYLGPWTARTASPVLVVGNFFDPATRYQGAVTASRLLPRSRLLSYAGWGHVAFVLRANFCVDDNVTRYLVTLQTPPSGTVCSPEGSPFGPTEASARARLRTADAAAAVLNRVVLPPSVRQAIQPQPR
jgi:pimeloyl-ACP methyl ester carboxylesterase